MKPAINAILQVQDWDFAGTLLKLRFAEAMEQGATRYPVFRDLKFAAPNVHDLDDALVRPGRCFAHVMTRSLSGSETFRLAEALSESQASKQVLHEQLSSLSTKGATLAEIYRAVAELRS